MSRWPYRPDGLKIDPHRHRSGRDAALHLRRRRRSPMPRPATADLAAAVKQGRLQQDQPAAAPRSARPPRPRSRRSRSIQPQMAYLNILREVLPANAIVTDELSQVGFASWYGFPIYEPRTFITSGYQGTLGSGFPTALGAKVANPDKPVVAITGDGGFMFGVQEQGNRRAVQHRRRRARVQQQRLRQCAPRPARTFRRPHRGVRSGQPGFRQARRILGVASARVTSPDQFGRQWRKRWPMAVLT